MQHPSTMLIAGRQYRLHGVLASSTLSLNLLYASCDAAGAASQVVKVSRMRGLAGWLLWPFLVYLSWREYRIYQRLDGVDGIPALGPRLGLTSFVHEFVPGTSLGEKGPEQALAPDFFDRLRALLDAIHARRVFYADLEKRDNILVGADGRPHLFDFQASFSFREPRGPWSRLTARWFQYLIREDYYHLYKHKRRLQPEQLTAEEQQLARRSRFSRTWKRYLLKPWKRLRAALVRRKAKRKDIKTWTDDRRQEQA